MWYTVDYWSETDSGEVSIWCSNLEGVGEAFSEWWEARHPEDTHCAFWEIVQQDTGWVSGSPNPNCQDTYVYEGL